MESALDLPNDYKVKLEVFEGPLDLLLYLIKRDEIDIYDIPIEHITRQYLEYLEAFKVLNLDIAGEFVVMAATLLYIKSRSLLPAAIQTDEEGEEEADPRWELVRQLLEYKKFKDAAEQLAAREARQSTLYPRVAPGLDGLKIEPERPLAEVSIFDLVNAFQKVLKKASQTDDFNEIFEENYTVSDKLDFILRVTATRTALKFSELFARATSRTEIVVTFLALLELIRLKQILLSQPEPFGEIELIRREEGSPFSFAPAGEGSAAVETVAAQDPAPEQEPEPEPEPEKPFSNDGPVV